MFRFYPHCFLLEWPFMFIFAKKIEMILSLIPFKKTLMHLVRDILGKLKALITLNLIFIQNSSLFYL